LHCTNPAEFLKGMPFDYSKAILGKIPPFHLTVNMDNGEHNNLDNASADEMANARTLIRYLSMGVNCGIAYYRIP
jgi:hypothetical protein